MTNLRDFMEEIGKLRKVEGTRLLKPYSNIFVGAAPLKGMEIDFAKQFDAFINVSGVEEFSLLPGNIRMDAEYHWIPIFNELGRWTYEPFIESRKVLDIHQNQNHKVYLHCREGINRSPSIAMAWLISREGYDILESALAVSGGAESTNSLVRNFRGNIERKCIPRTFLV